MDEIFAVSFFARNFVCLIVVAFLGMGHFATHAQTANTARPVSQRPLIGDAMLLTSPFDDRKLQVTATAFDDPLPSYASIRRGFRIVAAHVAVTNRGSQRFEFSASQITLLDDAGLYAFDLSWQFSDEALRDHPPLRVERLEPGESADGWLLFQISLESRPVSLAFLGYERPPYFQVLAWIDPVPPDGTGSIPILDPSGRQRGTFAIDHIITHFERTDTGINPARGSSTLALVVTIVNTSDETWNLRDDAFWIVDQYGLAYYRAIYNRQMTSYRTYPDLGFRARANERVQGVLMFELPDSSRLTNVLYVEGDDQLFVVGGPDPEITVAAEDADGLVEIDPRTSLDPACTGVEAWAEALRVSMEAAAQALDDVSSEETVTAGDLREGAGALALIKQGQQRLKVPDEAAGAQQDVVALLTVTISALQKGADRIDAGASPDAVIADIEAPQSPIMVAATAAARSIISDQGDDCAGG